MDSFETDSIEIATDVALGLCSEVERLSQRLQDARAENERLREALEPFAYLAEVMEEGNVLNFRGVYVTQEQVQAARTALEATE